MSLFAIYDQKTGQVIENGITNNPVVVELNVERANVKSIYKDGNDLIVSLHSGEEITIKDYYNGQDLNKLVIKDSSGAYYEVNLSQLNEQGLFEVVDYTPIESFTDYLYKDTSIFNNELVMGTAAIASAIAVGFGINEINSSDSRGNSGLNKSKDRL
ncbi:BapA prefix-like domain-containing protein, partial [Acinetobacter faecalis]|uniref:BapA/Bap/LapF family prefix-like domain-containing protein n=1 Tax=Acinetobacter faecalis TaxID=2665161 RepID=UPI002A90A3F7